MKKAANITRGAPVMFAAFIYNDLLLSVFKMESPL
jgi:hypothetical protein